MWTTVVSEYDGETLIIIHYHDLESDIITSTSYIPTAVNGSITLEKWHTYTHDV